VSVEIGIGAVGVDELDSAMLGDLLCPHVVGVGFLFMGGWMFIDCITFGRGLGEWGVLFCLFFRFGAGLSML